MNARAGYWDVESCAWVGAEPTHVMPVPADDATVPAPRADADTEASAVQAAAPST